MKKRSLMPAVVFLVFSVVGGLTPDALAQNCSTPPTGSYGPAWARQYQEWCVACNGTFSMASGNPSCTPGPNWGGKQSQSGGGTIAPGYSGGGMQGAILQGIQQGLQNAIQQGQQYMAEQMRQQQMENERAAQEMQQGSEAIAKDAAEKGRLIEETNRISSLRAKEMEAQHAAEILSQVRGEFAPLPQNQLGQEMQLGSLELKDLSKASEYEPEQSPSSRDIPSQQTIGANNPSPSAVVRHEQDEFDRMNAVWVAKQQELIWQAVEADKRWASEVLASIREIRVPSPIFQPKELKDLRPGDVLLIGPDDSLISRTIVRADPFYRAVDYYFGGDVSKPEFKKGPVSHAMTYVKTVNGEMLFLDHTGEGSRILNTEEFIKKYGSRETYVARPQTKVDGRELWETARESALQKKSDYGVRGGNVVCSERAAIAVAKATELPLQDEHHVLSKILPGIDITPNDFFDDKHAGKYFLISASPILPSNK